MNCKGCKWIVEGNWCDMKRFCLDFDIENTVRCEYYDDGVRSFDPEYLVDLCCDYVDMYNKFKDSGYMQMEGEHFSLSDVELLSFVLNDMVRELGFYDRLRLYDDLNK